MDIEDDLKCDWNDSENMTVWYVAGKVAEYLTDIVMDAASSTECVLATLPDVWDRRGNGKPSIGIVSIKEVLEEANRRGITIPEEFGLFCPYNQYELSIL